MKREMSIEWNLNLDFLQIGVGCLLRKQFKQDTLPSTFQGIQIIPSLPIPIPPGKGGVGSMARKGISFPTGPSSKREAKVGLLPPSASC